MRKIGKAVWLSLGSLSLVAISVLVSPHSRVMAGPTAAPVVVTNTPLPVQGSVNANVTNSSLPVTGTVSVTNLNSAYTPLFVDPDNFAAINSTGGNICADYTVDTTGYGSCSFELPSPPPGGRIVVENATASIRVPTGASIAQLYFGAYEAPPAQTIPYYFMIPFKIATNAGGYDYYAASADLRAYGFGSTVWGCAIQVPGVTGIFMQCTYAGHYELK